MSPDPEQIEIDFPDEDFYPSESDYQTIEYDEYAGFCPTWFDDPVDIDWDYGDDSEDEEFLSE